MARMSYGELERLQDMAANAERARDYYIREIRKAEGELAAKRAALLTARLEAERLRKLIEEATVPGDIEIPEPLSQTPIPRGSAGEDDVPPLPKSEP